MAKLIVDLPERLHKRLKKTAAIHHRKVKNVVTELVEAYLSREEKNAILKRPVSVENGKTRELLVQLSPPLRPTGVGDEVASKKIVKRPRLC